MNCEEIKNDEGDHQLCSKNAESETVSTGTGDKTENTLCSNVLEKIGTKESVNDDRSCESDNSTLETDQKFEILQIYKPSLISVEVGAFQNVQSKNLEFSKILFLFFALENRDIQRFGISWSKFDDSCLDAISNNWSDLREICLLECQRLTTKAVMKLGTDCKQLRKVNLQGVTFIHDVAVVPFMKTGNLVNLNLAECNITDVVLIELAAKSMATLESLDLSWCDEEVTQRGLNVLCSKEGPNLKSLSLRMLPATNLTLALIAKNLWNLRSINLSSVKAINNESIISLVKSLRLLDCVDLSWNVDVGDEAVEAVLIYCTLLNTLVLSGLKRLTSTPFFAIISDIKQWKRCKSLLQYKHKEREILREMKEEHLSSDEEYEELHMPYRSTTYAANLKFLSLEYCDGIDDQKMQEIVAICRGSLKIVDYYSEDLEPILLGYMHMQQLRKIQVDRLGIKPETFPYIFAQKYGMKVHLRDPSSYTPLIEPGGRDGKARSLTLGRDHQKTKAQIAQFSNRDAREYEAQLERIVAAIDPLIDNAPVYLPHLTGSFTDTFKTLPAVTTLLKSLKLMGKDADAFYELMTAPTTKILDKWFESEPLKATLATDSVIGAMMSPKSPGSGYVLLHHVMGELEGIKGAWGYVEGGMGAVSKAISNCATDHGAHVFVNKPITEILSRNDQVEGVKLDDGTEIKAKAVLSNATPKITYLNLIKKGILPENLTSELENFDYTSPVTKINVAVKEIPNFTADPNTTPGQPMPHHRCTIHLNCEHTDLIHQGYLDAQAGIYSQKPMIEMVIPSSLDSTIAPPGAHVCLFFTQYTPYKLTNGQWDEETKNAYADLIFDTVEQYAPGFKASVIGRDILTPPDLEATFGLTGGSIFHGAMSLDQLYMSRPISRFSNYRSPITGLYLCGSGAHPGGGVMGAAGRLASQAVLSDFKRL
ncbi:hypothetical protein FSP39_019008 [Pinctada imbricata]|uniref:Amine oxidase domain-containing protein n=1 Tax=Pinctada imbricata TaxID=66713 RepID=A0AA88YFM9_PINIB|nr:hypothetical protein FSP39_019008 [Pinctada imbricata]